MIANILDNTHRNSSVNMIIDCGELEKNVSVLQGDTIIMVLWLLSVLQHSWASYVVLL